MAKVFVADDNPHVHRLVEGTLVAEGHEVTSVLDGSDVLEKLTSARPDIALLDMTLPGAEASSLCEAIVAQSELDGVRIVMLAGPLEAIDEGEPLPSGVHSIVQKPLDASVLLGLVGELSDGGPSSNGSGDENSEGVSIESLVHDALGHADSGPSREMIREQIEAVVMASVPSMIDRIADRLTDRLRDT